MSHQAPNRHGHSRVTGAQATTPQLSGRAQPAAKPRKYQREVAESRRSIVHASIEQLREREKQLSERHTSISARAV